MSLTVLKSSTSISTNVSGAFERDGKIHTAFQFCEERAPVGQVGKRVRQREILEASFRIVEPRFHPGHDKTGDQQCECRAPTMNDAYRAATRSPVRPGISASACAVASLRS
ncbi:hypothetical protein CA601_29485 [Paraburkholderia hospita]|nr:hypothetical protein CA601_29485 [Paraburkholderia hospita]